MSEQAKRLVAANRLIEVIATAGRKFFNARDHGGNIAKLERDSRGKIWYIDAWRGKRVYTHYRGRWRGFSEGGTMRDLVIALRKYITHGTKLHPMALGPYPSWTVGEGDLWGYGEGMDRVRSAAHELEIIR